MTVNFIGAGPGDPDLITVKGKKILSSCQICFYAGSIIPEELLQNCSKGTLRINTAPMSLTEIIEKIKFYHAEGHEIARLHSGDLSVWSAVNEQIRELKKANIPFSLTPGVTSLAAAAASLKQELTIPGLNQSIILTRTEGRASKMPETETLENFAQSKALLAIHLSIHNLAHVVEKLTPHYGENCPVKVVWKASWPDELVIHSDLKNILSELPKKITRTALILVGKNLDSDKYEQSKLYDETYDRRFRRMEVGKKIEE
jgi:precorrin-4/cobalt-precorrin-4 C11-methyltransferase